jgi:MraZ protein
MWVVVGQKGVFSLICCNPMQPNDSSDPIYYSSVYRHGVDEKRRVQIPAKWRPAKPEVLTLIPWPRGTVPDACILVLPPAEIRELVLKLKAMSSADPTAQALRHLLGPKADQVTLDKGGRICLPEGMAKAAGIDREASLVGLFDRFEIWNPERYAVSSEADDQLLPEAFKLI